MTRSLNPSRSRDQRRKILVLYRTLEYPLRATIADHLFSFQRWSNAHCVYINVASQSIPRSLARVPFDLIVFHTTLLSSRVRAERFRRLMSRLEFLSTSDAVRIALPQDEHVFTTILAEFVNRLRIDHVFSVAPASTWPMIYQDVDPSRTAFHHVLTGYLEPRTLRRIERLGARTSGPRSIDVGYRAHGLRHNLGNHGHLKIRIASAFAEASRDSGLCTDISTRFEDTFLGDSWYRFLLRCRFALGIEGGASLHDPDGSIDRCVQREIKQNPCATFREVEAACFAGKDGAFPLFALSPRHLEAAATRTAQLLVEGDYNGILHPGVHYIPIRKDLSNLDDVVEATNDEATRLRMADRAYDDIVRSGEVAYERFIDRVLSVSLIDRATIVASSVPSQRPKRWWLDARIRLEGWVGWLLPLGLGIGARSIHALARRGPRSLGRLLRGIERRIRGK